jgi:type IV conjugative transfer system coupling protein TraD
MAYFVFFILWKKASARWTHWFPLFQNFAKAGLWVMSGVVVVGGVFAFSNSTFDIRVSGAAFLLGLAVLPIYEKVTRKGASERHERGAVVAQPDEVRNLIKKEKQGFDLVWGGVPVPHDAEPYHFMIAGSTGAGKSVAINRLLDMIRDRGDTAIIVDSGGDFMSRYWREETDHVINPFDARCAPWSPTAELEGPWDAEALSRSMIPDGTGESKEWNGYAQTLVTCAMQALWEKGKRSLGDLMYAVQAASIAELTVLLAGTSAAAQLSSDKTFGSIRTIASKYLQAYAYLISSEKPFSVANFIRQTKGGMLFLTYRDDQLDSLRNLVSCVLDIASRTILSMRPDKKRRVWLIIDEFASIGKVQSIEAVATKARKAGGCLVLGVQSVSQLKERYGEHTAQTILSCLSTWMVLRCIDADTAEYMSKYIGEEQITRTTEGSSEADSGKTKSWNAQTTTQRVVMASEIQKLATLTGFLKLAGHYPVCEIKLELPSKRESQVEPFSARDFDKHPMMKFAPTPEPTPAQGPGGVAFGTVAPAATAPSPATPEANKPVRTILLRRN